MFSGCNSLSSVDLSTFNTCNVTDMNGMFSGCNSLSSLDLLTINTSSVTNMNNMLNECIGPTFLDLSGFVTSDQTQLNEIFIERNSLKRQSAKMTRASRKYQGLIKHNFVIYYYLSYYVQLVMFDILYHLI